MQSALRSRATPAEWARSGGEGVHIAGVIQAGARRGVSITRPLESALGGAGRGGLKPAPRALGVIAERELIPAADVHETATP
ncbi:unnamed protein product [Arctogadus glacialis]